MKPRVGCRYSAIIFSTLLGGCAHERAALPVLSDQVRVEVTDVTYDHPSGAYYLVLEEKTRRRVLPITIGDEEARAIMFELHGIKPERPLTYELLLNVLQQTGNRLDRVVIGEVREEVYYAKVYLDGGRYEVDSRPSDAVALAIGAGAPIFVAGNLLQTATAKNSTAVLKTVRAFGVTVQELTPELAQYFSVTTHSGVLVADIDPELQKSGISRGDILEAVNGRAIQSAQDYAHSVPQAGGNSKVSITVRHDGVTRVIMLDINPAHAQP
jgi:uncharacterized protein